MTHEAFYEYLEENIKIASDWVKKFKDANEPDEIFELRYWYGQKVALESVKDKWLRLMPPPTTLS